MTADTDEHTSADMALKIRLNRLRLAADRQGLRIKRSRRRDYRALDYGGHWLIDKRSKKVIVGGEYGTSLDGIESALNIGIRQLRKR